MFIPSPSTPAANPCRAWYCFALAIWMVAVLATTAKAAEFSEFVGKSFPSRDSLGELEDLSADARECLAGHRWTSAEFKVEIEAGADTPGDLLVRFPSPVDTGDAVNDRVAMEWYVARDDERNPIEAPAVIVVHESGRRMTVGRTFAVGLRSMGLHTLLIQLPDYGHRRSRKKREALDHLVVRMRQGIADVRRARDAVAVLPLVNADSISLQGTSLGGMVAANAAALDNAYSGVFLMLAGGELYDLIQNGEKAAAKVRMELAELGIRDERLQAVLWPVEPTRIAHRLVPDRTWLYSGTKDRVVPLKNAEALATAARLKESHHIRFTADHYSGVVYFPMVLSHIRQQIP